MVSSRVKSNQVMCVVALVLTTLPAGGPVRAQQQEPPQQEPTAEERLKILTDPESVKQKLEKEKQLPPLEVFRSQVAPFDILPFVKPNHWSALGLEMRANNNDYAGVLQTEVVPLQGRSQAMIYRRDARLLKGQTARVALQVMLPQVPRELTLELVRPDGVRADETWKASLRTLDPHQMLIVVLTRGSSDGYSAWGRSPAFTPTSVDPSEFTASERHRYYRLVLPMNPERPLLSPHPLTWTSISHVIWDGMPAETLAAAQQEAMLDWLHWGGQIILVGGAALLRGSFLDPYLPADPSSNSVQLGAADLKGLAVAYPPAIRFDDVTETALVPGSDEEALQRFGRRYRAPAPIRPPPNRPLQLAGLDPRPGSTVIPLDESTGRLLGVERRVGRGRILMLTVNPTDAALASWPGLDTLVRRVLLRRPEEHLTRPFQYGPQGINPPEYAKLSAPELSWFRLLSRDFASPTVHIAPPKPDEDPDAKANSQNIWARASRRRPLPNFSRAPVAEWKDDTALPRLCRDELERASGITIPSSTFVLKVILAYLFALVPLNWLICRYILGRRELAWLVVPALSLGFAIGVERAAAYDMGYDTACDEIDVIEVFGDYPRAHLSRFASLYSTGRAKFAIGFPGDPLALALPLDTGRALRGEDVSTSVWQSYPTPTLESFTVQPRSLAMFRSEQMATLSGAIRLERDGQKQRIVNATELELQDAVLIDVGNAGQSTETFVGTIAPGLTVEVAPGRTVPATTSHNGLNPAPFLREFRAYVEDRPENQGEIRLVGWSPGPHKGMKLAPVVDRHRGFGVVVVHLKTGPPPAPDGPSFNSEADAR
jgi:hypothetical protein